jgi:hypothetical protein
MKIYFVSFAERRPDVNAPYFMVPDLFNNATVSLDGPIVSMDDIRRVQSMIAEWSIGHVEIRVISFQELHPDETP